MGRPTTTCPSCCEGREGGGKRCKGRGGDRGAGGVVRIEVSDECYCMGRGQRPRASHWRSSCRTRRSTQSWVSCGGLGVAVGGGQGGEGEDVAVEGAGEAGGEGGGEGGGGEAERGGRGGVKGRGGGGGGGGVEGEGGRWEGGGVEGWRVRVMRMVEWRKTKVEWRGRER